MRRKTQERGLLSPARREGPVAATRKDPPHLLIEAVSRHRAGRLAEAASLYQQVLRSHPRNADALHLLGVVAHQTGDHPRAVVLIRKAIARNPNIAAYHNNLGAALLALDRREEAGIRFAEALRHDPNYAEAHNNAGNLCMREGRPAEAESCYRKALAIKPDYAIAHNNLGGALREQGLLEPARSSYEAAISCTPQYATALSNLGRVLHELGRFEEALAAFGRALAIDPALAEAHANRATTLLLLGRLAEGWEEYEWRWRVPGFTTPRRDFVQPLWDGSPLTGRTIFLHAEQGLGSAIQFVRYVGEVATLGGSVILECQKPLLRLFAALSRGPQPLVSRVIGKGETPPAFDVHAPLMSLPRLFDTRIETIPAAVPYLSVDEDLIRVWQQRLGSSSALRVGLVWAGNPRHANDRNRSMPADRFLPLVESGLASFFSLQMGAAANEAAHLAGTPIRDLTPEIADFADTAAVLRNLDLVISVDTAVAHLAGALARPVWMLVPFVPEWRWLLEREDTPWYPTMRLFRQRATGDWAGVIGRIIRALGKLRDEMATPDSTSIHDRSAGATGNTAP
jgi:tetratricopeptide (TPR) repeat protein